MLFRSTYEVRASGVEGLEVLAEPASAGPAAMASMSVSLRLPFAAAQALAGQSVPVVFEVKGTGSATNASTMQSEKSSFYVPR